MTLFFYEILRLTFNVFLMLTGICFALVLLCPVVYVVFRLYKKVLDLIDR